MAKAKKKAAPAPTSDTRTHDRYAKAIEAIDAYAKDGERDPSDTLNGLRSIRDHVHIWIDSLK